MTSSTIRQARPRQLPCCLFAFLSVPPSANRNRNTGNSQTNSSKESYPVRPKSQPASAGFTFQPGRLRPGDAGTGGSRMGERRDHQSRRTRRTKRRPQGVGATFSTARLLASSPARLRLRIPPGDQRRFDRIACGAVATRIPEPLATGLVRPSSGAPGMSITVTSRGVSVTRLGSLITTAASGSQK